MKRSAQGQGQLRASAGKRTTKRSGKANIRNTYTNCLFPAYPTIQKPIGSSDLEVMIPQREHDIGEVTPAGLLCAQAVKQLFRCR